MFGSSSLQDSEYPRLPGVLAKFEYELSEEEEEVNYQVEKLVSYQIEKIVVKETLVSNKVEKLASMQANNTPNSGGVAGSLREDCWLEPRREEEGSWWQQLSK